MHLKKDEIGATAVTCVILLNVVVDALKLADENHENYDEKA